MWPYPWTHVGTPSHLGHMDRVAATMPSQAHARAAQEAPDIGQWEGQDVPLVRPSSCNVKGGIPSSRRYLPTSLPPTPNRPITLDRPGHPATRCPQPGPLNGLRHVQAEESKIPPLGKLNGKKCHEAGVPYPHGGGPGNPRPPVDIKGIKKKAVPLLNGTALSTQGSGNPELLEGTKRKCDPSSSS